MIGASHREAHEVDVRAHQHVMAGLQPVQAAMGGEIHDLAQPTPIPWTSFTPAPSAAADDAVRDDGDRIGAATLPTEHATAPKASPAATTAQKPRPGNDARSGDDEQGTSQPGRLM